MTIDLTGIATAIISVAGSIFLWWLQSHMKDKQAAQVIGNAISNSIGILQQVAEKSTTLHSVTIPGVSPALAPAVQYVLDNAGPELKRFSEITPVTIASKVEAKVGLKAIDANIAIAASPAPELPHPLDPVPTTIPSLIPGISP